MNGRRDGRYGIYQVTLRLNVHFFWIATSQGPPSGGAWHSFRWLANRYVPGSEGGRIQGQFRRKKNIKIGAGTELDLTLEYVAVI